MRRQLLVMMLAASTFGCGASGIVRARAVRELGCKDVEIESVSEGTFIATGCGKTATYTCMQSNVGRTMYSKSACVRDDPPSDTPIVVTTAPATPTQSNAPSQFPPPTGAGGFELGMSDADARSACEGAGHVFTAKKYGGLCDGLVKAIDLPAIAGLRFCGQQLCEVNLVVERPDETLEQSVLRWKRSLTQKYGPPTSADSHVDSECADLATCVIDKRATVHVDWAFPTRQTIVLSTIQTGSDASGIRVRISYASGQRSDGL